MWLDVCWGEALLGLGRPGAVEHIARAARSADRLNVPVTLDRALRIVAIAAAEAGLIPQAATLAGYTEAALRPYRADQPGQAWIQARLDRALAGVSTKPSPPATHRREIMNLVDNLETAIAHAEVHGAP
jgi:hypothetical protein